MPVESPSVSGIAQGAAPGAQDVEAPNNGTDIGFQLTAVESQIRLADLLDICSHALDRRIEFDPEQLQGMVHPLPGANYTPAALLAFANRELELLDQITIQAPGSSALQVVPLSEAKIKSGLLSADGTIPFSERGLPGYIRVLVPLEHADPKRLQTSLKELLSPHGQITPVGDTRSLLVADLTPRVTSLLYVLRGLDIGDSEPLIELYDPQEVNPKSLAGRIEQLLAKRNAASGTSLQGSTLVLPESSELILIAPPVEMAWWLNATKLLDRPEPSRTIRYTPRRFGLLETRDLVLAELSASPFGFSVPRIVVDDLTGALITTATPSCHDAINDILNRLEEAAPSPLPKLRVFQIENRPAGEVQALLGELLSTGVLQAEDSSLEEGAEGLGALPGGTGGPIDDGSVQKSSAPKSSDQPFRFQSSQRGSADAASITVDTTTNQILAFGPPGLLDRIEGLIDKLDLRQPQILIEATVVSLSESEARSLGVELAAISTDGDQLYQLASLFGVGAPDPSSLALPALSGTGAAGTVLDPGEFSAAVRALETITEGRTLTRPKLLVNAGRTADLGSVLQTPFISTNASSTVSTTSLGGTLDAGTQILATPQVSEAGRVTLQYTVSISNFVGEASDPSLPPPRQENHIQSEVTIPDGYTVVVGGLEIDSEGRDRAQVPLLGSIPLLGALFRDEARSSSKNRFFVFIRCSVMQGDRFESLRYHSEEVRQEAGLPDEFPPIEPMVMR